ncbi:MAG TPA: metallophosphoesterase, partial [Candidatus Binatia bacterium]|nr:metallophosphoesterase [Candidatus Binatia bacterium]
MSDLERERREAARELNKPDDRPDPSLKITRRTFLHKSIVAGTVTGVATYGWFPLINTLSMAFGAEAPFSFAWISDTHLYPKNVNTRFVEKATRAVKDVQAMKPAA